jgi:hypothetical protein
MSDNTEADPAKQGRKAVLTAREKRLKAALKDNMAKRKAQAKARAADGADAQKGK